MAEKNYGNNVNEYYVQLTRKNFADRAEYLAKIQTKEAAEQYVADLKQKMAKIFAFPERTPLNPVVTGKKVYDGYTMETLYYYSRPDYPVTANFFLPANFSGKLPGVLFVCGHSDTGKAADAYITCAVSLAKKGFAVLAIDPVEQGERKQYKEGGLCANHNLMGKQQYLVGEWFGAWRTWDGVRGLDYLESRPEVDAKRLCVTGNSGGGTLTTWIAAADPRPVAVAPSCYVTSWKHNVENELPADIEQMPPDALKYGLEMGDFLLAQAPRNILILGQKKDFFDPRGAAETYEDVKRMNDLLGGNTALHIGPDPHGYSLSNREAMYKFFTENILGKADGVEPENKIPTAEETYAVKGNVSHIAGQKYLREFTVAKLEEQEAARKTYDLAGMRKLLADVLQFGEIKVPYYRCLRARPYATEPDWKFAARFGLETEDGQVMAVLQAFNPLSDLYCFDHSKQKAVLYIPDQDSLSELLAREECKEDTVLFGLDIRGFGEMMPTGCDLPVERDFYNAYQFDYHYAALSIMFGKPIMGGKVRDILCAVELLAANGYQEITLEGHGLGTIPALFAAVLSDKVSKVKLTDGIDSYADIIRAEMTVFPLSCMVPDFMKYTDLPQLRALIADKLL
ncbi:MAG: acetylxylan esterase [Lentisphaeria bacterium]|nr:acetylxylan esterase [Lentisphaeria bacterium]